MVVLTTCDDDRCRDMAAASGCAAHLLEPCISRTVLREIDHHLGAMVLRG
jgi:hypothetical protein